MIKEKRTHARNHRLGINMMPGQIKRGGASTPLPHLPSYLHCKNTKNVERGNHNINIDKRIQF